SADLRHQCSKMLLAVKDPDLGPVLKPIMSDSASADLLTTALRELHAVGRWSKTPTLVEQQLMLASKINA
ncbi:hypothetical protein, partial [Limnohabitans planktonicus]